MNIFILPLPLALAGWQLGAAAILTLFILIFVLVIATFFMTWLRAKLSGSTVGFPTLIAMRLRRVPASLIVDGVVNSTGLGFRLGFMVINSAQTLAENIQPVRFCLNCNEPRPEPGGTP